MPWLKVQLQANKSSVGSLTETLEKVGALAVSVEDAETQPILEDDAQEPRFWRHNRVTGLFQSDADIPAIVEQIERRSGPALVYRVETLQDQRWETVWRERCQPLCFGRRLWVCPAGVKPPSAHATAVFIDPGLAFGTGSHATTAQCLEWIAHHNCSGKTVIDYGCGSGILAIAALKRGANFAWGIDNDPRALKVSQENATRNQVAQRYLALAPQSLASGLTADIVLANLFARPLIELAPRLIGLVRRKGFLLVTGLLAEQVELVSSHYARDLAIRAHFREADGHCWALLVGWKQG
ncbi:MAG: 50S ribosomal protein L11 methyltransferase [Acidiferrobacterales bacterium]